MQKNLFCKHYFSPLNTFIRKAKDPAQRHKIMRTLRIRIPNTGSNLREFPHALTVRAALYRATPAGCDWRGWVNWCCWRSDPPALLPLRAHSALHLCKKEQEEIIQILIKKNTHTYPLNQCSGSESGSKSGSESGSPCFWASWIRIC
jgi:hypothetical protein